MPKLPTFSELIRFDDQLADRGVAVFQRPFEAAKLWGDWQDALEQERWFRDAYTQLHPSVDFTLASFLTLAVSARGISYQIKPPIGFGEVFMEPLSYVAITEFEKRRLYQDHQAEFWELQWQAVDAVDLFMAHLNFHPSEARARNMIGTAVNQLTASSRQLIASEIDASLPQGVTMAVELAAKAVLATRGYSDKLLRVLGHDLRELTKAVNESLPSPCEEAVVGVAAELPEYVEVRYDAPVLTIAQAQGLFAKALFMVAEFLRRTNHEQIYWKALSDPSFSRRKFDGAVQSRQLT